MRRVSDMTRFKNRGFAQEVTLAQQVSFLPKKSSLKNSFLHPSRVLAHTRFVATASHDVASRFLVPTNRRRRTTAVLLASLWSTSPTTPNETELSYLSPRRSHRTMRSARRRWQQYVPVRQPVGQRGSESVRRYRQLRVLENGQRDGKTAWPHPRAFHWAQVQRFADYPFQSPRGGARPPVKLAGATLFQLNLVSRLPDSFSVPIGTFALRTDGWLSLGSRKPDMVAPATLVAFHGHLNLRHHNTSYNMCYYYYIPAGLTGQDLPACNAAGSGTSRQRSGRGPWWLRPARCGRRERSGDATRNRLDMGCCVFGRRRHPLRGDRCSNLER